MNACPNCGKEGTPVSIRARTNIKIALGLRPEGSYPPVDTMLWSCIPCLEQQRDIMDITIQEIRKGSIAVLPDDDVTPEPEGDVA